MKTATKTATATTSRGTVINITATATRGFEMRDEVSFCDGDNVPVKVGHKTNDTDVTLEFAGKKLTGSISTRKPSPSTPDFFGYFLADDNKTVMPFDEGVYNVMLNCKNGAVKEAETDGSWIAQMAKEAENIKMNIEYDAHVEAVENMMARGY